MNSGPSYDLWLGRRGKCGADDFRSVTRDQLVIELLAMRAIDYFDLDVDAYPDRTAIVEAGTRYSYVETRTSIEHRSNSSRIYFPAAGLFLRVAPRSCLIQLAHGGVVPSVRAVDGSERRCADDGRNSDRER